MRRFLRRAAVLLALVLLTAASSSPQKEPAAAGPGSLPEPVLQNGHSGVISCLAYSPDGRVLATGSVDHTIKVWDADSGRLLATLTGHSEQVNALSFSPDGSALASGSDDGIARLWDVNRGKCRYAMEGAGSATALSRDGSRLATGRDDGLIRIWDTSSGQLVRTLGDASEYPVVALAFSPDGRKLAAGGNDKLARLWDMDTGKRLATLSGHGNWILNLAVSPDGRTLATVGYDQTARLWDMASGKLLASLEGHRDSVRLAAYSPDGKVLATGSRDGTVKLWEVPAGRLLATLEGHADEIWATVFSPDGHVIATGSQDGTVKLWDVPSGSLRNSLANPGGFVTSIAFRPDGRTLAAGGLGSAARHWDLASGEEINAFREAQSSGIVSMAFSPGGSWLATGSHDGAAKVWDLAGGRLLSVSSPNPASLLESVLFSPDGNTLLVLNHDGPAELLDAATGRLRFALSRPGDQVTRAAFSPDGRTIATGSQTGSVALLDADTAKLRTVLPGHTGAIAALSFSPDGSLLAAGSYDDTVCVWDCATGSWLATLRGAPGHMRAAAFSPDGRWLATGGYDNTVQIWVPRTGTLHAVLRASSAIVWSSGYHSFVFSPDGRTFAAGGILWNRETGKMIAQLGEPSCAAFSPDGRLFFTGSDDGAIKLWEAATGRLVASLSAHTAVVRALTISPNGRILASASEDTTIKLWDAATGDPLATALDFQAGRDWLAVSPEGFFDGTAGGWQKILWRLGDNIFEAAEPEQYFSEFYQPGLLKDVFLRGKPIPEVLRERGDPRASLTIAEKDRRLPVVAIDAPRESSSRMVTVKLRLNEAPPDRAHPTGSQVKDVRLFRDGTLVAKWPGERKSGSSLSCEIPIVRGLNSLSAYAFNRDNVKSRDVTAAVRGSDSLQRPPRAFILSIGINRYSLERLNLGYAVQDADDLAAALKKNLPFPADRIVTRLLLDEKATRAGMLAALRDLVKTIEPEDSVIITYSGHGAIFDKTFYFLPHDLGGRKNAPLRDLCARGVSDKDLQEILTGREGKGGLQARQIALIIDACRSGQVLEADEWRVGPMNSRSIAQLAWEKGMEILTASQSDQFAIEMESLGHGLLTYALLQGFSEAPREGGRLLGEAWLDYAASIVPRLPESPKTRGIVPPFVKSWIVITDRTLETLKGRIDAEKIAALKGREYLEGELAGALRNAGFTADEVQAIARAAGSSPERREISVQTPKAFHRRRDAETGAWIVSGRPGDETIGRPVRRP